MTTFLFIFLIGVFVSSYVGSSIVWLGECLIKRVPLIKHIYSASKQISNAISPGTWDMPRCSSAIINGHHLDCMGSGHPPPPS